MIDGDLFQRCSQEIEPDKDHGQIIIEVDSSVNTLKEAIRIIESIGVPVIEWKFLLPEIALLKLGTTDMRHATLTLTETGFSRAKGFNSTLR
jgi:hypothetical protein